MRMLDNVVGTVNNFLTELEFYNKNIFMNFLDYDGDVISCRNDPRFWTHVYSNLFNIKTDYKILYFSNSILPDENKIFERIEIEV